MGIRIINKAKPAQVIQASPAAIQTLGDLIDNEVWCKYLHEALRRELKSALRRLSQFLPGGRSTPASPKLIREGLNKLSPAMVGMSKGSFSTFKSRVRRALNIAGIKCEPKRYTNQLLPEWAELLATLPREVSKKLSHFAHYAAQASWTPDNIADAHFTRFSAALADDSVDANTATLVREAQKSWNKACGLRPGLAAVTVLAGREGYAVARDQLPVSLNEAFEAYLQSRLNPVPYILGRLASGDDTALPRRSRAIRTTTAFQDRVLFYEYISALVQQGVDPASLIDLETILNPRLVDRGLQFLHKRPGGPVLTTMQAIAIKLTVMAKDLMGRDHPTTRALSVMSASFPRRSGLTDKNRNFLRQFDDPRQRRLLLDVPAKLVAEAKAAADKPGDAARLIQIALATELLLNLPVRVGNLVRLDMARHLVRPNQTDRTKIELVIPGEEVKNGMPIEAVMCPSLAALCNLYQDAYRHLIPGASDSTFLFPRPGGRFESYKAIGRRIGMAVFRLTGIKITPHQFRHFAAKLLLDDDPGSYELARQALNHSSIDTTRRSYTGVDAGRALKIYDDKILNIRNQPMPPRGRMA